MTTQNTIGTPPPVADGGPAQPPMPAEQTARLVIDTLGGPVDRATLGLLVAAARGDPALVHALVVAGIGLGVLTRQDDLWRWNGAPLVASGPAATGRDQVEGQLAAFDALTRPLARARANLAGAGRDRRGPVPPVPVPRLTRRESDVLVLLCEGLTAEAMARRLGLSPRTVSKHQERLYRKLGTADRLTTVLYAQRLGLAAGQPAAPCPPTRTS